MRQITTLKCTVVWNPREEGGREGLCARRRINLVDEMAVNERRDRAGKSERARAGEMVGTKGPDGRGAGA